MPVDRGRGHLAPGRLPGPGVQRRSLVLQDNGCLRWGRAEAWCGSPDRVDLGPAGPLRGLLQYPDPITATDDHGIDHDIHELRLPLCLLSYSG